MLVQLGAHMFMKKYKRKRIPAAGLINSIKNLTLMKFTNYAIALALFATSSVFAAAPGHKKTVEAILTCAKEHKEITKIEDFKKCCKNASIEDSLLDKLTKDLKDMTVLTEDHINEQIKALEVDEAAKQQAKKDMIKTINDLAKAHRNEASKFHEELKKVDKIKEVMGEHVLARMLKMKPHELDEGSEIQDLLDEEHAITEIMKCKETDKDKQKECLNKHLLTNLSEETKAEILKLSASEVGSREHIGNIFHKDHEAKVKAVHETLIKGIKECFKETDSTKHAECLKKLGEDHKLTKAQIDELAKKEVKDLSDDEKITKHVHSLVHVKTNAYVGQSWYANPMVWICVVILVALIAIILYYYNSKKQSVEESTDI